MSNLKPDTFIHNMNQFLPIDVRKKIKLSIVKVWQENEKSVDESKIDRLIEDAYRESYSVSYGPEFQNCYVDNKHFNCIFSNGMVDKCDNEDIENCRGKIDKDGNVVWSELPSFPNYTVFCHQNECTDCRYLPICYGPCPVERERAVRNGKLLKCRFSDKEKVLRYRIYCFCRKYINDRKKWVLCA